MSMLLTADASASVCKIATDGSFEVLPVLVLVAAVCTNGLVATVEGAAAGAVKTKGEPNELAKLVKASKILLTVEAVGELVLGGVADGKDGGVDGGTPNGCCCCCCCCCCCG